MALHGPWPQIVDAAARNDPGTRREFEANRQSPKLPSSTADLGWYQPWVVPTFVARQSGVPNTSLRKRKVAHFFKERIEPFHRFRRIQRVACGDSVKGRELLDELFGFGLGK